MIMIEGNRAASSRCTMASPSPRVLRHVPRGAPAARIRGYHRGGVHRGALIEIVLISAFSGLRVHDTFIDALRFPTSKAGKPFFVVTECHEAHVETSSYLHEGGMFERKIVLMNINTALPNVIEHNPRVGMEPKIGVNIGHDRAR